MAKLKKIATLLTALLLVGSVCTTVACGKGNTNDSTSSESSSEGSSESSSEGSSESSSEEIPVEPTVFTLEEHTWTAWETVTEKTCTTDGLEKLVCTDDGCGAVKTRTVKAGHIWGEWTGSTDNICAQDVTLTRTCTECSATDTMTIPMRGHVYEDGFCKNCLSPFVFPDLDQHPSCTDVWDISVSGAGEAYNRKRLQTDTYYTLEVPVSDFNDLDHGVWISVPVSGPGQYALCTVGGANGVTIDRLDAPYNHYIPTGNDGYIAQSATVADNGESYSMVNCGVAYWNVQWSATWRFSANTAATVKFIIVKVAPPEWEPESLHVGVKPTQINNVKADEAPESYTTLEVGYNDSYYYDEWNGVYRRGSKSNPGEVIYLAIGCNAPRLFGEQPFTNVQEDGNNLSLYYGEDAQGNYIIRDYHAFLLSKESSDNNVYENFINSDGMYPVTQELQEFLYLYTRKNRPVNMPDSIWDDEAERAEKAWLAPCYYYCEVTPGSEDNPFVITDLGDFKASTPAFDVVYFRIAYQGESGAAVSKLVLSCTDANARININGTTYNGPFEVEIEVNGTTGLTFYVGACDFSETTFTLNVALAPTGN